MFNLHGFGGGWRHFGFSPFFFGGFRNFGFGHPHFFHRRSFRRFWW